MRFVTSYGESRRRSIGGEVVEAVKSIMECMRRLHNDRGDERGVPTTEAGGDCMSGGNASGSGV
jgi:hypothetical protein